MMGYPWTVEDIQGRYASTKGYLSAKEVRAPETPTGPECIVGPPQLSPPDPTYKIKKVKYVPPLLDPFAGPDRLCGMCSGHPIRGGICCGVCRGSGVKKK